MARVIQAFFPGGQAPRMPSTIMGRPAVQRLAAAVNQVPRTGAPAPAFRQAPTATPIQAHGNTGSFAVDPHHLGLNRGGGQPLPTTLLAKMESAFGTDFSAVRIHEGPQAARIGALAFTIGSDIYFASGRYQPETRQGQQILGHELAHVVQQRQGRVRSPAAGGLAVVHDHALEAEADRLGQRAAMAVIHAPPKAKSCGCGGKCGGKCGGSCSCGKSSSAQPLQYGRPVLAIGTGTVQASKQFKSFKSMKNKEKNDKIKEKEDEEKKQSEENRKGPPEKNSTVIRCYTQNNDCSGKHYECHSAHNCCDRGGQSWEYKIGGGCFSCRDVKSNEGGGKISKLLGNNQKSIKF